MAQNDCSICDKKISSKRGLDVHRRLCGYKTGFPGHKWHKCDECPAEFPIREYLTRHKRVKHPKPLPHACDVCEKTFAKRGNYIRHIMRKHGIIPPITVEIPLKGGVVKFTITINMEKTPE